MQFNLLLWPMLVPMLIPLFYCIKYKKESLVEIGTIILIMIFIVVFYWPLLISNFLSDQTYFAVKIILFVILPGLVLLFIQRKSKIDLKAYGIKKDGHKKSLQLFILFLPIMLTVTAIIKYYSYSAIDADLLGGSISFFEAFTEEFFFRGILFIFLLSKTNLKVAYITSLASFILMHPNHIENYTNLFFISTIVQGILTIEISRRSNNIFGAWLLHGTNRFFILAIIPLIL